MSTPNEEEFEEHRIRYGYPDELQAGARTAAAEVYRAVLAGEAPFDSAPQRWVDLAVQAGCTAPR